MFIENEAEDDMRGAVVHFPASKLARSIRCSIQRRKHDARYACRIRGSWSFCTFCMCLCVCVCSSFARCSTDEATARPARPSHSSRVAEKCSQCLSGAQCQQALAELAHVFAFDAIKALSLVAFGTRARRGIDCCVVTA